jgi:hypothetical protein
MALTVGVAKTVIAAAFELITEHPPVALKLMTQ